MRNNGLVHRFCHLAYPEVPRLLTKHEVIINSVQTKPIEFQLAGSERLRLKTKITSVDERLDYLEKLPSILS